MRLVGRCTRSDLRYGESTRACRRSFSILLQGTNVTDAPLLQRHSAPPPTVFDGMDEISNEWMLDGKDHRCSRGVQTRSLQPITSRDIHLAGSAAKYTFSPDFISVEEVDPKAEQGQKDD